MNNLTCTKCGYLINIIEDNQGYYCTMYKFFPLTIAQESAHFRPRYCKVEKDLFTIHRDEDPFSITLPKQKHQQVFINIRVSPDVPSTQIREKPD